MSSYVERTLAAFERLERENAKLRELLLSGQEKGERMIITDELREWAKEHLSRSSILAIADRIDAEHEKAVRELNNLASACVLLPKDADGEYIHVGDVLTDGEYKFKVFELAAFGDGSWSIRNEDGNAWAACDVTHYHAPTVEDVLRDMHAKLDEVTALYVGEAIDSDERDSDEARIFAEYASKLRLAGDAE